MGRRMTNRLLKLSAVKDKTGMGSTWIYDRMKAGEFPRPVKISTGAVRWIEREIDDWISRLDRAP